MSLPTRSPGRALALLKAQARASAWPTDPSWPARLAEDLRELAANWRESAQVCADTAWAARAAGHSVLGLLGPEQVRAAGPDPVTERAYRHLYLSALRYDFRCRSLQAFVEQLPSRVGASLDCYSRALYAFALLGQSRHVGLAVMDEVLAAAGDHAKTRHVLLHGLWLGQDLDRGAERLLALSSGPPFDTGRDPNALFRMAGALRRLGRCDEGLAAIDRALELLPPGDITVHADLVRERSLTAAARDLHQRPQARTGGTAS
ncbi:hypothetical protein OIE62_05035 [Streptomyces scopuliridis]|uniref:Uncharacterized protein n=1 Tax=Streptomyces scopuliridis TaxID=452529 RepID=A0ACD4ZV04_9ACTN|nr:hypothetical protein [Streptomyces scopuliridis]WSB37541.1 hypothetical protein OG949_35095 [Streptomyces scopuliridis]WSC02016.1 hypothetical protein OG835_36795 [Streptomyces scopuliridis]WSC04447.1 hypothetical protein OIE62_05035 [Streptomyces scopuliridis]